jgi:HrpA-like RNA helicase
MFLLRLHECSNSNTCNTSSPTTATQATQCTNRPDLKLVLMSATLNAELFTSYFNGAPCLDIPGRTCHVDRFFLEDAVERAGYRCDGKSQYARRFEDSGRKGLPYGKEREELEEEAEEDREDVSIEDFEARYCDYSPETQKSLFRMDLEQLNVDLLIALLHHIDSSDGGGKASAAPVAANKKNSRGRNRKKGKDSTDNGVNDRGNNVGKQEGKNGDTPAGSSTELAAAGAVLVFLSGIDDITEVHTQLMADPHFSQEAKFNVLVLHSMLSSLEQTKVFARPPAGVRKIILCTNIAESSVTIDDVIWVIDAGRQKELTFDFKQVLFLSRCEHHDRHHHKRAHTHTHTTP